jgi:hypothetical protein
MSRGQWLALTTVALVGCTGTIDSVVGDGGGGAVHDSGAAGLPDASGVVDEAGTLEEAATAREAGTVEDAQTATSEGGDSGIACASRSGYFACGSNVCDRAIQACYSSSCDWYGNIGTTIGGGGADAAACGSCPSCACLQPTLYPGCNCAEDDAGTIVISCQGCYGSPPGRLERIA